MEHKAHRLPTHVRPLSYAVDIATNPARPEFEGTADITVDVLKPTQAIEMHARDLALRDARVTVGEHTFSASIAHDASTETVTFHTERTIPLGHAKLSVHFRGAPSTSMHGLYLARDGGERAICTQCEATDARAIFPCFDEPEMKATIAWTIRTEGENLVALANTPLLGVEDKGAQKIWSFQTSSPIPSYLFALVVGDLEGTPTQVVAGTPSRVWAMRGKADQAKFAQSFTARLIPWYERYFDYAYPFKKYDQVAVPGFDAGAMENVGLVLFRQNLLLMDPRAASWNQEKTIAKVIAHELAHMWFGNLVTMRWWDDLWLNEAFAEWMAHKATHAIEPTYLVWNDFQADKNRALIDDALPTTHPIWNPVKTPSEAIEMFDVITYQKGCAVMRMLENFLGESKFEAGLRTYMKAFALSNAAGADLWRHLENASGLPVGSLMRSWVEQPGFPIVDVALEGTQLALEQRRFTSSPKTQAEQGGQLWSVPMVVRFEDDRGTQEHRFILDQRTRVEPLPASGEVKWLAANAEEIGFYRVNPKDQLRERLLKFGPTKLSAVEQMGFVEDQWALVRNGMSTIERFMPVLSVFASTRDHNVLRAMSDRLNMLDLLLKDSGDDAARRGLRRWVADALKNQLDELGYSPKKRESQNDMQRRALVLFALANLARVEPVIDACVRFALEEQRDPRAIDANLSGTFVAIAARFGDDARYSMWMDTYQQRKAAGAPPQDCLRYLYTLAMFRPEPLTRRTLAAIDNAVIPQEAVGSVLAQLFAARESQELAWEYLKTQWEVVRTRVGDMGLSRVVEAVGHLRAPWRADIVAFFADHTPKGAERALKRALEGLDQREELRQRVTPSLLAHFSA